MTSVMLYPAFCPHSFINHLNVLDFLIFLWSNNWCNTYSHPFHYEVQRNQFPFPKVLLDCFKRKGKSDLNRHLRGRGRVQDPRWPLQLWSGNHLAQVCSLSCLKLYIGDLSREKLPVGEGEERMCPKVPAYVRRSQFRLPNRPQVS